MEKNNSITYFNVKTENSGRYLFVSDVHGFDKNLIEQLKQIAKKNPPKIVFFLGDIIGTKLLDDLQNKFYAIFNRMKSLPQNASHKEIQSKVGINAQQLIDSLNQIYPNFNNTSVVEMAISVSSYQHFGHFVSNLSPEIRQVLRKDLIVNANHMAETIRKFTRQGSRVVIIEGNWDARTPLDFQVNEECLPIPINKRSFYFKKFVEAMRNQRITFVSKHQSIETEDYIFQIISFDGTINYRPGTFLKSSNNKPTVLVSHVQADWQAIKKNTPMTSEGEQLSQKIQSVISDLKPKFMVHGHLHDILLNEQGQECSGYSTSQFDNLKIHYLPLRSQRFIHF